MSIVASTGGTSVVTLDTSKLRLFARPHVNGNRIRRERRVAASIGQAQTTSSEIVKTIDSPQYVQSFSIPVKLSGPPGPPGIYDVWARALDGFATKRDGTPVSLAQRFTAAYPEQVWWPDESGNDRELVRLRKELVGRFIYGYGHIAISCPPSWTKFYAPSTPIRVRSIAREHGHITWLGTGSAASDSYPFVSGAPFIAFDPLLIVVEEPSSARYPPTGENHGVGGAAGPCPGFKLADWQVDTTLSLLPPPAGIGPEFAALRVGMTRDEVIWTRGYPNEVGTRAALRGEPTWHYGVGLGRSTVTFIKNRVAAFTTPNL